MNTISSAALALAMIACFLLVGGAVKLFRDPQTRGKGGLMLAAALVILGNVLIWTL